MTSRLALPVLLAFASTLFACGVEVEEKWVKLVPKEGLENFMPREKTEFEGEGATMFYASKKVSQKDLHKAFEKQVTEAGYKLLIECEEPHLVTGGKDENTIVNIGLKELTSDTLIVEMTRAEVNSIGFPEGKKCKWTDAAKDFCEVKGDECDFRAKKEKKK